MMGWGNVWQLDGLFLAAGLGFLLGFIFDILRVVRVLTHPSPWAVFVQDVLFCVGSAMAFFFFSIPVTGGTVRAYLLLGTAVGTVAYFITFGRFFVTVCRVVLRVWRRVTTPIRRVMRRAFSAVYTKLVALCKPLWEFSRKCSKKVGEIIKKVLHLKGNV